MKTKSPSVKGKTKEGQDFTVTIHCSHAELRHWSALKPNPENPNFHSEAQLSRLEDIVKFHGWRHPIIVSSLSDMIVAGHARYNVAKRLNIEVPVDYQSFPDRASEISFLHADNRIAELAELDMKVSSALLASIKDSEAFKFTGFSQEELEKMTIQVGAHSKSRGLGGSPVIQYNIVFDNADQQAAWFAFVRDLKLKYPTVETIGARIVAHIETLQKATEAGA